MKLAFELALKSQDIQEVPVGAIIVQNRQLIVGSGYNYRETSKNSLYHAEILAINNACKFLNSWRLVNCEIFVTLEPCSMCAGAIINSRLASVIYGASDPKNGAAGSVINLFEMKFTHRPKVYGNIMAEESSKLLSNFFKNLRNK
ncbi:MAG: nucleoside deaminase [Candidatus Improbicoccus devescovinae]|nr:MAG: nucleoside deaminase [Candidatus Improbicoccus devescovinae]